MCLVVIGRHVEHLKFLHILLSDEPALSPAQALYMRLLTEGLEDEAAQAEAFLKSNSIEVFSDTVALKALDLVQKDAGRGTLEQHRAVKIRDAVLALLEGLDKKLGVERGGTAAPPTVLCVAAKTVVDESAGHLLTHLLRRRGVAAAVVPGAPAARSIGPDPSGAKVICLCLSDARMLANLGGLAQRLKQQFNGAAIVVWPWSKRASEAAELNALVGPDYTIVRSMGEAATRISTLIRDQADETAAPPALIEPIEQGA
jgi:hypothetical protein